MAFQIIRHHAIDEAILANSLNLLTTLQLIKS